MQKHDSQDDMTEVAMHTLLPQERATAVTDQLCDQCPDIEQQSQKSPSLSALPGGCPADQCSWKSFQE